jgi:hypothetical protein
MKEACHTFIAQLHTMLETEDSEIVSWTENSYGFRVKDTERFKNLILAKYYRHTKLASFQRQLNLYGFKKLSHGPDMGSYYHPLFYRGAGSSLKDIKRSAIRQSAVEEKLIKATKTIEEQALIMPKSSPVVVEQEIVSRWDVPDPVSVCDDTIDDLCAMSNKMTNGLSKRPSEMAISDMCVGWSLDDTFDFDSIFGNNETQALCETLFSDEDLLSLFME